jgi:hypothetical protein
VVPLLLRLMWAQQSRARPNPVAAGRSPAATTPRVIAHYWGGSPERNSKLLLVSTRMQLFNAAGNFTLQVSSVTVHSRSIFGSPGVASVLVSCEVAPDLGYACNA